MSYKFSPLVLITFLWISIISCDDTLTPKNYDDINPYVIDLTVNPSDLTFDPALDGQKDTTITFDLNVKGFNFESDAVPYYSIFIGDQDIASIQGKFLVNFIPLTTFTANIPISTNTIEFETYTILVTPTLDGDNQNYTQAVVRQRGVPINAPEILEVNNPSEVEIPSGSNTTTVLFTAKVKDLDGQSNIDRVLLNFRNEGGSLLSESPFDMFDNGTNSSGDITASDSVFTTTFIINSSNTPNNRTALYWAIDKSGLSSDTVETTFNLVDNE